MMVNKINTLILATFFSSTAMLASAADGSLNVTGRFSAPPACTVTASASTTAVDFELIKSNEINETGGRIQREIPFNLYVDCGEKAKNFLVAISDNQYDTIAVGSSKSYASFNPAAAYGLGTVNAKNSKIGNFTITWKLQVDSDDQAKANNIIYTPTTPPAWISHTLEIPSSQNVPGAKFSVGAGNGPAAAPGAVKFANFKGVIIVAFADKNQLPLTDDTARLKGNISFTITY